MASDAHDQGLVEAEYEHRVYHDVDFPHGLRCEMCDRVFVEGVTICEEPEGFIGDTLMVRLICGVCSLGKAARND